MAADGISPPQAQKQAQSSQGVNGSREAAFNNPKMPSIEDGYSAVVFQQGPEGVSTQSYVPGRPGDAARMSDMLKQIQENPSKFRVGIPGQAADFADALQGQAAINALKGVLSKELANAGNVDQTGGTTPTAPAAGATSAGVPAGVSRPDIPGALRPR